MRKADFTTFICRLSWKLGASTSWNPQGLSRAVMGLLYLLPFIHHHSVFCLTRGPKPPPKRFLHIVRSRASSFKWEYPLLSLRSFSSFLRLLPRLLVTSITSFIFPSITYFRRQFLRKMWPIQLAFRFLISCRIFLCSLTLSSTSSFLTWSVQLIFSILLHPSPAPHFKTFQVFLIWCPKRGRTKWTILNRISVSLLHGASFCIWSPYVLCVITLSRKLLIFHICFLHILVKRQYFGEKRISYSSLKWSKTTIKMYLWN